MNRLDMNTCQTSIKTDVLLLVIAEEPILVLQTIREHHSGSYRTDLSGEGQTDKTKDLPNTYSRSTAETIMNPIGHNAPVICLHFETKPNNPASF